LSGDLEGGSGPGGVLEEEVDDRAPPQGRQLLDVAVLDLVHRDGGVEDRDDLLAGEVGDREQVLHGCASGGPAIRTPSGRWPSCSARRTITRSAAEVGRFLPT